ncbi:MAG: hypothetical protein K0R51_1474 [Cytophagaceae bacterium]|jgi:hypothetical protein|nr:hypothetical protein [Cytophagaceae bacterium]
MLKRLLLVILFFSLFLIAKAQVYEPAFILTVFGDTIRCQLKHIRFISSKTEFRYKKSLEDKKDLFINAKDVLWIITPKDTFECLAMDKGLYKGQVNAYKLLSNGHLRLYEQDHFTKAGGEAAASFFVKKEGMILQEITAMDYKKYLLIYGADQPDNKAKVDQLLYKEESLMQYVKTYNDWHDGQKTE